MTGSLVVRGAREHNLKGIDVTIPRGKLTVVTGLSGSGKSSLAFDTIYAEGQRRYVESLSAYARQFLGQMKKPEVEHIEGLSPAISIDQKTTSKNPRSTVGTVTEIYDYLRLLWAHVGTPHCPTCGRKIGKMSVDQIVHEVLALPTGTKIMILAPVVRDRKGEYAKLLKDFLAQGFSRVRVDGKLGELDDDWALDKRFKHTLEIVIDRLTVADDIRDRVADAVETSFKAAGGLVTIASHAKAPRHEGRPGDEKDAGADRLYSEAFGCPDHGAILSELVPRVFSFNSPHGACGTCSGLGFSLQPDEGRIIRHADRPVAKGAFHHEIFIFKSWMGRWLRQVARHYEIDLERTAWKDLPAPHREIILWGAPDSMDVRVGAWTGEAQWEGIAVRMQRLLKESTSEAAKVRLHSFMGERPCATCKGQRLRREILAVRMAGSSITDTTRLSIDAALAWFESLPQHLTKRELDIGREVLKEVVARLRFLTDVGLGYLSMDRMSGTLSGGESQRIRLASQIGSGLQGVLYVLDEPSIGLHQRDNHRLIATLKRLRDLDNTVIVVEHDEDTMRQADYIVDLGPGAGEHGGELVAAGTPDEVALVAASLTGQYLAGKLRIELPASRRGGAWPQRRSGPRARGATNGTARVGRDTVRDGDGATARGGTPHGDATAHVITVVGARENNLKDITVAFPLGRFVAVTGVSGSGKSTLVGETLYKGVLRALGLVGGERPGDHDRIDGLGEVDKVIDIDQSPIGRTPRSNPATYTGVWTPIRDLFSETPDARARGYKPGRFSFNVKGGRCEACEGDGVVKIEMHFLPDVYVPCEVCKGARYNQETLQVRYKGKNIHEVLELSVEEALGFFVNVPSIRNKMQTIFDVGLGYIRLGQPATQLSGGEAQRVKLATELSKRSTGKTLYILDEPTTGLHVHDIRHLLAVLQRLVDEGNTVVVIEHNLDVVKCADWVIDLGPEGGDGGGEVIAEGTPEEVAAVPDSFTGQYLRPLVAPALAAAGTPAVASVPAAVRGSGAASQTASHSPAAPRPRQARS
jgi:excinuclease ABC subunit A